MAQAPLPPTYDEPLSQCPLCGSDQLTHDDHTSTGQTIDRCRDCRLLFMNPQYTDEYLTWFYSQYIPHSGPPATSLTERRRMAKREHLRWIERYRAPGRLLAIGCGDGLELELARARGWYVEGFDVDPETAAQISRRTEIKIHSGDFFQLPWFSNHYDAIYLDQVLEHPRNPQDYLRAIHAILKPGGVLYIGCPNIGSLANRFKTLLGKLGLRNKRRGSQYDTSHHLFYYVPQDLARTLTQHFNYEVVSVEGDPLGGRSPILPGSNSAADLMDTLRRWYPLLDSNFKLLARKPAAVAERSVRRAA